MPDDVTTTPTDEQAPEDQAAPGSLAPIDGPVVTAPAQVSDQVKTNLKLLVKKTKKNVTMRRIEVKEARRQRSYYRGDQHLCWDNDKGCWRAYEQGSGDESEDEGAYSNTINIYAASARAMGAVLTQSIPAVRFEPSDPDKPVDIATAVAGDKLRQVIERDSDVEGMLSDAARFMWTDGRTAIYSRWTTDGQKYGYTLDADGKRQPNSREEMTAYGVLEVRVPIGAREISKFPYLSLSEEIDKTIAQTMFPDIADSITEGGEEGDDDYARLARLAIMAGGVDKEGVGESEEDQVTYSRTWLRPSSYRHISDVDERTELEKLYPDGAMVSMIGDTFAAVRNESMDSGWTILHPQPCDGQASMSLGAAVMPVQDLVNEQTDLRQECYSQGISVTYVDGEVVDLDAIEEEDSKPGAHIGASPRDGQALAEAFYQTTPATVPADLVTFFDSLMGAILEQVTGLTPAIFGQSDSANETASGIAQLRDAAMGVIGQTYRAFRRGYTSAILQAVKAGCKNRDSDIKTSMPGKKGKSTTLCISLQDLKGAIEAYPNSDEGYPQTWSQKRGIFLQLMGMGDSAPIQAILQRPKNLALAKDLLGLEDLEIPGADSDTKQMQEIEELLGAEPIPNAQAAQAYLAAKAQALAAGQPVPPQPPYAEMFNPSVEIDEDFDANDVEFATCQDWINSPTGQTAKREQPEGFQNVKLHALLHKAAMEAAQEKAAAAQAPPPPPPKPPSISESVNFKDLPPASQAIALQHLGLAGGNGPQAPVAAAPPIQ